ncbi:hypothetical protein GT347_13950 [Xylophilus rhododendri]|uniref:protein O-GlcNAc transferase n=1 Tax=Xylophilus rhododendri TaxID=2697032 RepID=A0A857J4U9_9BURK|nr:tetratricopeptide repeat protein [Xylophilus rhododendri]QHI98994.1 hypothetical protein GT347_13950 [Xylophilus rhododendri]
MLRLLVGNAFERAFGRLTRKARLNPLLKRIAEAHEAREWRAAIDALRELLRIDPQNVSALIRLGISLVEIGETAEAYEKFSLAYRLDDSNMEAVVNYARCLLDSGDDEQARVLLVRAQTVIPGYPHIDSIYSSLLFRRGDTESATTFALRAWLSYFDNGRMPDGYLWTRAYEDKSEQTLAAEHHFWAQTSAPLSDKITYHLPSFETRDSSKKLRIGYWSPDFRDHSVRYFFRPLLEGHDRERVEIFIYHDSSSSDAQTEEIKARSDHFHAVYKESDESLVKLIGSHDLDVLVELAGHTSHNRLWLLKARLARVQVSGLGYPPTTGLETVDAKFVDPHLRTPDDGRCYTEAPLELPQSLWCFDPRGDAPEPSDPPMLKAGFVTFGCYGNIAKINPKIMGIWAEILRRVPRSRLVLQSVNFQNPGTCERFGNRLIDAGLERSRFTLLGPVPGRDFFRSYNQLDIVLDTHPFNGGTTTCFAVFMGVPVVTLQGDSLISRVGVSVMSNVGAADLAVSDVNEYVSRAVRLSQDVDFLKKFRKEARLRMQRSSLGNGRMFAQDVEAAFTRLVEESGALKSIARPSQIVPLPAHELIRRAMAVLGTGQWESSRRIVSYCLAHYPDFAGAHIMMTEDFTSEGRFADAARYLEERFDRFAASDRASALVNIARYWIYAEDWPASGRAVAQLELDHGSTLEERLQARLFKAFLEIQSVRVVKHVALDKPRARKILCVLPCDDVEHYQRMEKHLTNQAAICGASVVFQRCAESLKIAAYESALRAPDEDIVLFIQKNISIGGPGFFERINHALESADVVGYSGAKRWVQLDWRLDDFGQRAAAFIQATPEKSGFAEVLVSGGGLDELVGGLAVLEGGLLAVNARRVSGVAFDHEWMDAETLLEEKWSYEAGRAGARLAVHRGLGVYVDRDLQLSKTYMAAARTALVAQMGFDVFSLQRKDGSMLACPVPDFERGVATLDVYFSPEFEVLCE